MLAALRTDFHQREQSGCCQHGGRLKPYGDSMRYALVQDERREAEPGLSGTCPGCGQAMIPKCGDYRVHHWAHRGARNCDSWWEPETPWHRNWKMRFPKDWQEVIQRASSGEKHIADVRTEHGLVLEIQHSHIRPDERRAREAFYPNLAWIVDATRRKRDLPRFEDGRRSLRLTALRGIYTTPFPDECFARDWLDSRAPVFFDFTGTEPSGPRAPADREVLWGLLPGRAAGNAVVIAMPRRRLVRAAHRRPQILASRKIVETLDAMFRAQARLDARRVAVRPSWRFRGSGPRRRKARF
jgi:competence protein CoiA